MKVLLIGEVGSIHVARWVNQLQDTGWDVRVFQALPATYAFRDEFKTGHFYLPYPITTPEDLEVEYTLANTHLVKPPSILKRAERKGIHLLRRFDPQLRIARMVAKIIRKGLVLLSAPLTFFAKIIRSGFEKINLQTSPDTLLYRFSSGEIRESLQAANLSAAGFEKMLYLREKGGPLEGHRLQMAIHIATLAELIKEWQPDVIHSLGMFVNWANNPYTILEARRILGWKLPCPWIISTWGADLDLYPFMGDRQQKEAEAALSVCDGLVIEGNRDIELARKFKFRGKVLAKIPAFGGVTWNAEDFCLPGLSSSRRVIVLKGRDNTDDVKSGGDPQGRAMTAMHAFQRCQDLLRDYYIVVVQSTPAIEMQAKILTAISGLKITTFPNSMSLPYKQWLNLLGSARIMIAVTASDGLPSTLVEAMSLGVFPIHSGLDTIQEWISNNDNGILVPPEDVDAVTQALRSALTNDDLIDCAALKNKKIVEEWLSDSAIRNRVISLYESLCDWQI